MGRIFCITDYGAVANDGTLQTAAIQAAIDACFLAGGGEVTIPSGVYRTGGLRIRSYVTLHLLRYAVLEGSRNPEDYTHFCEDTVEPIEPVEEPTWPKNPFTRWCNALIRAHFAHDFKIIGDVGSCINGMNCYDAMGEEEFRGPHAIGMYRCYNVELCGYTIKDSGNWAHELSWVKNLYVHSVNVQAGHDGVHCRNCENVIIEQCTLHTGDDSVAGFNNLNMAVLRCDLNSACSAFRLGGTDILIDRCCIHGPGIYGHRWKMSKERQIAGEPTNEKDRHNTLTGFLYFCCGDFELQAAPGNIVVQNCEFTNVDSLFILEYQRHIWCCNRSLESITFKNCRVEGVNQPMQLYSDAAEPLNMRMEDCEISLREGAANTPFSVGYDFESLKMYNVHVSGYEGDAAICIESHDMPADQPRVELYGCTGVTVERKE